MSNSPGSRPALALGAGLGLVILRAGPGPTCAVAVAVLRAFAASMSAGTGRRTGARDLVLLAALVGTALVASSIHPSWWTASRVKEI